MLTRIQTHVYSAIQLLGVDLYVNRIQTHVYSAIQLLGVDLYVNRIQTIILVMYSYVVVYEGYTTIVHYNNGDVLVFCCICNCIINYLLRHRSNVCLFLLMI